MLLLFTIIVATLAADDKAVGNVLFEDIIYLFISLSINFSFFVSYSCGLVKMDLKNAALKPEQVSSKWMQTVPPYHYH